MVRCHFTWTSTTDCAVPNWYVLGPDRLSRARPAATPSALTVAWASPGLKVTVAGVTDNTAGVAELTATGIGAAPARMVVPAGSGVPSGRIAGVTVNLVLEPVDTLMGCVCADSWKMKAVAVASFTVELAEV